MQRFIGGLAPLDPGYRRISICPRPGGGLTSARASHQTPYGLVECAWKIDAGMIIVDILVPANTTAQVTLPGGEKDPVEVGSGSYHWSYAYVDPDARGPLTVDDVIGEIMSDPNALAVVIETIRRIPGMGMLLMVMQNERNQSLRQLIGGRPGSEEILSAIDSALANVGK